jgi:glutamate-ammonia-ligase adenylyltransferase
LAHYGFRDPDKAWQNLRLIALGPAGRLLPPAERRAFLEFVFPLLEVMRDSIDPDRALHNLESFAASTGNRISFLRMLASRKAHLARLANLLALSNLCQQILTRHPEYFDGLARGIGLHEERNAEEMQRELGERFGASPRGESRDLMLRRYRQREMVRIAYRDLAALADALETSRELSALAEACVLSAAETMRPVGPLEQDSDDRMQLVALGKMGSSQMHYSSDLDLVVVYDPPGDATDERRAAAQLVEDERVERMVQFLAGVTAEGIAYAIDLRLRPEGASGLLARSWQSFRQYAESYMQPWERMALVRSRMLTPGAAARWNALVGEVVYDYPWSEDDLASIRHLKRRIETEKNKESRISLDFKYGEGGIADLEFLVQFLQIGYGRKHAAVRTPRLPEAVAALHECGALTSDETQAILAAHRFQRALENHYQLMEEWPSREVSRESPMLTPLARSLGFESRQRLIEEWQEQAEAVRRLVKKHFLT